MHGVLEYLVEADGSEARRWLSRDEVQDEAIQRYLQHVEDE